MLNINGREWNDLTVEDVEKAVSDEEESFFFEFKEDRVEAKKLTEEISAFSNTYGGYIFLGVSDEKVITGCTKWNEQRIHAMIHDSLSPTPSFDVKKFTTKDIKDVFVIKIEPGSTPPYVTSKGKIYERVSSGSFAINDSTKLTQMYYKRENELKRIEKKITIDEIGGSTTNVFGYLDIGFSLEVTDSDKIWNKYAEADLKKIASELKETSNAFSISRIGYSIVISVGEVKNPNGNVMANLNNFIEIMGDGSAKLRVLLVNNEGNDSVNIAWLATVLSVFEKVYRRVFEDLGNIYIYAYKYEKLAVLKQFTPIIAFDGDKNEPTNKKYKELYSKHRRDYGDNRIITSDRIPKSGMRVLDKRYFNRIGIEYDTEHIIQELFSSEFVFLGYIDYIDLEEK